MDIIGEPWALSLEMRNLPRSLAWQVQNDFDTETAFDRNVQRRLGASGGPGLLRKGFQFERRSGLFPADRDRAEACGRSE